MPRAANTSDWVALLALTVLWGTTFAFNDIALGSFSPAVMVGGRVLIAALVLLAFMRASGVRLPRSPRAWLPMLIMALFGNVVPFQLIAWAQLSIDSSIVGVLMAVMPLFILTLAHFFVPGARLTPYRVAGFIVGFGGVVCVIGPSALIGLRDNAVLWGSLAVLGAAMSYSINTIYARRLGATNPIQLSAGMMLVASLLCMPRMALDLPTLAAPTMAASAALAVLGLLSTGLATVLYFRIIQGPGPTFLSLVNYLVPAWAVLAGAWFLDESLTLPVCIGLALILTGIAASELGPRVMRALQSRPGVRGEMALRTAVMEDA